MPDEETQEQDEFWGFEDLEFEFRDEELEFGYCDSSTSSPSIQDSVSTKSN